MHGKDSRKFYFLLDLIDDSNILKDLNDNWDTIAPFLLDLNSTVPKWDQLRISGAIREHYFGNGQINHENGMKLIQLMTDRFYGVDLEEAVMAQARANTSPTYLYYYSFKTVNESLGKKRLIFITKTVFL